MVALDRDLPQAAPPPVTADAIPLAARRRAGSPRQVVVAVVIGCAMLALFAARDLPGWAERLGDGPTVDRLHDLATLWDRDMAAFGLARPHEALRETVRRLRDLQWTSD